MLIIFLMLIVFFIYIDYEKLPLFCEFCKIARHSIDKCWKYYDGYEIAHFIEDQ